MQAERVRHAAPRRAAAPLAPAGVLAVCAAAALDAASLAGLGPWPPLSYYAIAVGVTLLCAFLLLATLRRSPRGPLTLGLFATGLLLLAWTLRGHPGIPPDPPLVGAEILAALLLVFMLRRVHAARASSDAGG